MWPAQGRNIVEKTKVRLAQLRVILPRSAKNRRDLPAVLRHTPAMASASGTRLSDKVKKDYEGQPGQNSDNLDEVLHDSFVDCSTLPKKLNFVYELYTI